MKILMIIILTSFFSLKAFGQSKYVGQYSDFFGGQMKINADSTFEYTWHFDISGSWTKGKWKAVNDTLFFKMVPVYDTLRYTDHGRKVDSLVLSLNEKPKLITAKPPTNILYSGGQNYYPSPDKLYFKRDKLYAIRNGKLDRWRVRGLWSKKKFHTWFIRQ